MRHFFLSLFLLGVVSFAFAQSYLINASTDAGNPGGLNLEADTATTGWTDLFTASPQTTTWSATQSLPFAHTCFGVSHTDFNVSHLGLLTFDTGASTLPGDNQLLASSALPTFTIAAYWDQYLDSTVFTPTSSATVATKTFGTAPNRQVWIRWLIEEEFLTTGTQTSAFAVVIDEGSDVLYLVDMYSDRSTSSVSIGFQRTEDCAAAYGDASQSLAGNTAAHADNDYYTLTPADLKGTYTIGGDTSDFVTLRNAAAALGCGVDSTVILNLRTGTYLEQVKFPFVAGASASRPVVIQAESGDSADVIITWPSSASAEANYTLQFDSAAYFALSDLTLRRSGSLAYGTVVDLQDDCDSLSFRRVHFWGTETGGATANVLQATGNDSDSLTVDSCTFSGGEYGIVLTGTSRSTPQQGHLIRSNAFTDQQLGGMSLTHLQAATIWGNDLTLENGGTGLRLDDLAGGVGNEILVANNRVKVSGDGSNRYGIQLLDSSESIHLFHNSVLIEGDAVGNRYALYTNAVGPLIEMYNNLWVNAAGGEALHAATPASLGTADYNAFRSSGGDLANFDGVVQEDLADLQTASGQEANSWEGNPRLSSDGSLTPAAVSMDGAGTGLGDVSTDYVGQARSGTAPDIGAMEFTPQVYQSSTDVCVSAEAITSTGSGTWQYIYADDQVIAAINDQGNTLGTVSTQCYVNTAAVREATNGDRYLDRNWSIQITGSISGGTVSVRLYYLDDELQALLTADPTVSAISDLGCTRYSGNNQNCAFSDNGTDANDYHFYEPLNVGEGVAFGTDYWSQVDIEGFSEFYLTGNGIILPLEHLSWHVAQHGRAAHVGWEWPSASALYEIDILRSLDGDAYEAIGTRAQREGRNVEFVDREVGTLGVRDVWYQLRSRDADGQDILSAPQHLRWEAPDVPFSLFPNPADKVCRLLWASESSESVQIAAYDVAGRMQWQGRLPSSARDIELTVNNWPPGVYWVQAQQLGRRWQRCLVVY